jgi:hypothetical protein
MSNVCCAVCIALVRLLFCCAVRLCSVNSAGGHLTCLSYAPAEILLQMSKQSALPLGISV